MTRILGGLALILLAQMPIQAQDGLNPCSEGFYLDKSSQPETCRLLKTDFGFRWGEFNAAFQSVKDDVFVVTADKCDEDTIYGKLQQARNNGGGTVDISACGTVMTGSSLRVWDNTILKGAGVGQTILKRDPNAPLPNRAYGLLGLTKTHNAVIRDLTVDGNDVSNLPINVNYARNVMLERIEVKGAYLNGIVFPYSAQITVRYSSSHDHVSFNGITSKECYNPQDGFTAESCEQSMRDRATSRDGIPPGALFTTSYALYSNDVYNVPDYCFAMHSRKGEIAGNDCYDSARGVKLPDGKRVVVHHNRFFNINRDLTLHVYQPFYGIQPDSIYFFENRLWESTNNVQEVNIKGSRVHIFNNQYNSASGAAAKQQADGFQFRVFNHDYSTDSWSENDNLPSPPSTVYICSGTDEETYKNNNSMFTEGTSKIEYADALTCSGEVQLPVELTRFDALQEGEDVVLRWQTAAETENAGFALEGAREEEVFQDLAFISGAGTTTEGQSYVHRLDAMLPGHYRFRLRQVDLDGQAVYSPVVELIHAPLEGLSIHTAFPNPFAHSTQIRFSLSESQPATLALYDALGRRVRVLFQGRSPAEVTQVVDFKAEGLADGLYWLRLESTNGAKTHRLVIRH